MSTRTALKLLSVRNGLRNARYFVGRRQELSSLESRLARPFDPVWIHGPHRIGKSALAWMGARLAENEGATVLELDVIDHHTLDDALCEVLRAAEGGFSPVGTTPREAFSALASAHEEKGLVVVFDEFDAIAVNLRTEEQAYLRKLVSENSGLGFVFVTTQPPTSVMEEVPDKASRLSGVCKVHPVPPLRRADVSELCYRVADDMKLEALRSCTDEVWDRVGGFTLASVAFIEALARRVDSGEEVDSYTLDETLQELDSDVIPHFRCYAAGLRLESRLAAAGRLEPEQARAALSKDRLWERQGFVPSRLLREVAIESANASAEESQESAAHRVLHLVADVNDALRLRGHTLAFRLSTATLRVYELVREPVTERVLGDSINFLYKTFYELARSQGPVEGKVRYLLPEALAKDYGRAPVVGAISDLRNYLDHVHDRPTDDEKPNKHYMEAGRWFQHYCGKRAPADEADWKSVRDGLVRELAELLTGILDRILVDIPKAPG